MPRRLILFNGGLVTSRDESLLRSDDDFGELSRARDAEYLPNDPGIWPVLGRERFNATAESGEILSAGFFEFEPGIAKVITLVGSPTSGGTTTYRIADLGATGAFADLVTGVASNARRFDQVNHRNQHLICNGVDTNRVVSSDLSVTPQGMTNNAVAPTLTRDGGGPFAGFILSSGSTIIYWIEERVKVGTTIVRRNGATATTTVTLTGDGTNDKPRITRPAVVNPDATHWALFATETNGTFPIGAEIAEATIATTFIDDNRTATNPLLPSGATYPVVAIEITGLTTTVPKFATFPVSSTCDVFEGSIVQNDVANEAHVRFTFPDEIHAMPSINLINIRTKYKDRVVWIRTLGRACLIGMEHGLWRLDTLPLPEDAAFQPDRVKTELEGAFGSVSPKAVTKFAIGDIVLLAYVSPYGIVTTDGSGWNLLSNDVDWENTVNVPRLANSVLVNNAKRYRLELYYEPLGAEGNFNTEALYFHYHPSHLKPARGNMLGTKVTGPINVRANDAFYAQLSANTQEFFVWTANRDGHLYREGVGNADPSGAGGIVFNVRTGDLYLNGIGGEATFRRGYLHHSAGKAGQQALLRQRMLAEGDPTEELTELMPLDFREATAAYQEGLADAFQFGIEMDNPGKRVRMDYLVVEYDEMGEEQAE